MTKEEQRIRKQIAFIIGVKLSQRCGTELCKNYSSCEECLASQILSIEVYKDYTIRDLIKEGVIVADDQSLPENPFPQDYQSSNGDFHDAVEEAQDAMLKPDSQGMKFVRVSPRDNKGGSE